MSYHVKVVQNPRLNIHIEFTIDVLMVNSNLEVQKETTLIRIFDQVANKVDINYIDG